MEKYLEKILGTREGRRFLISFFKLAGHDICVGIDANCTEPMASLKPYLEIHNIICLKFPNKLVRLREEQELMSIKKD